VLLLSFTKKKNKKYVFNAKIVHICSE